MKDFKQFSVGWQGTVGKWYSKPYEKALWHGRAVEIIGEVGDGQVYIIWEQNWITGNKEKCLATVFPKYLDHIDKNKEV